MSDVFYWTGIIAWSVGGLIGIVAALWWATDWLVRTLGLYHVLMQAVAKIYKEKRANK